MIQSIDITPTRAQAAQICRMVLSNAYNLDVTTHTDYQLLWAWKHLEHATTILSDTGWTIPSRLVAELAHWILDHAAQICSISIDGATTYNDLARITA